MKSPQWGLGAIDFAGGLVVHINAGVAALALVLVLGVRKGVGKEEPRAHFLPPALSPFLRQRVLLVPSQRSFLECWPVLSATPQYH